MKTAMAGMTLATGHNWSKEAVAVRLLLRTATSLQGVVLMAERGMVSPARTLVRTIVEDSFCAAALLDRPNEVIRMLRDDHEASRRGQAAFIYEQGLGDDPDMLARLQETIAAMERKPRIIWKNMAGLGSLLRQYLNYQRLSDDSLHTSALSLDRHVARRPSGEGWDYRYAPGLPGEIASTLHRAGLAAVPVGIVVTQLIPETMCNPALKELADRFEGMPTGTTI